MLTHARRRAMNSDWCVQESEYSCTPPPPSLLGIQLSNTPGSTARKPPCPSPGPCFASEPSTVLQAHWQHHHIGAPNPAGKKKRRVQQPKPQDHYNLDMGAMEFSSTQQMLENEPPAGAAVCSPTTCSCLATSSSSNYNGRMRMLSHCGQV